MVGGVLAALAAGRNDPGFVHNGALAGLIAVCAGSDLMHPLGALATGAVAAIIFVYGFQFEQERLKIDDVLGVWPLHGVTGTWGGIAAGIFGQKMFGGVGGISLVSQLAGSITAVLFALVSGLLVYGVLLKTTGIRLHEEDEYNGADLAIHKIGAYPEDHIR
jgi:Amt family ammonium transporter